MPSRQDLLSRGEGVMWTPHLGAQRALPPNNVTLVSSSEFAAWICPSHILVVLNVCKMRHD